MCEYEPAVHPGSKDGQQHPWPEAQSVDWAKGLFLSAQHLSDHAENTVQIFGYPRHKEDIDKVQEIDQRPSRQPEELLCEKRLKVQDPAWMRNCLWQVSKADPSVYEKYISRKWKHTRQWDRKVQHSINWNKEVCAWI